MIGRFEGEAIVSEVEGLRRRFMVRGEVGIAGHLGSEIIKERPVDDGGDVGDSLVPGGFFDGGPRGISGPGGLHRVVESRESGAAGEFGLRFGEVERNPR